MEYGQSLRARMLDSWLVRLSNCGVTPDAVTLIAGCIGLAFAPLWLLQFKALAIGAVAVHVLLDGLDGPLARHQQIASPRGSFTDTFADQLVVTAVTVTWMIGSPTRLHIAAGSVYVFLYALVVAMAMVRNALEVPYSWLVRPRFFVYLAIAIDWQWASELTSVVLLICNSLLAIKCASGFLAVRRRLPGPDVTQR